MTIRCGFVVDPLDDLKPAKDTSVALMLEAQQRGWEVYAIMAGDLFIRDGEVYATMSELVVCDEHKAYYQIKKESTQSCDFLDCIMMRLDPPVNQRYLTTTHILGIAERRGVLVCNRPEALTYMNEKILAQWVPQCTPDTLVSCSLDELTGFT